MIFLDSTVLTDYFNGKNNWQVEALDSLLGNELVVIGDYVLAEVLNGFWNETDYSRAKTVLFEFPCLDRR
jgi:predicted nucleic acid-binding protein